MCEVFNPQYDKPACTTEIAADLQPDIFATQLGMAVDFGPDCIMGESPFRNIFGYRRCGCPRGLGAEEVTQALVGGRLPAMTCAMTNGLPLAPRSFQV